MKNIDKIYLINMKRSTDRLDHFMKEIRKHNLPFEKLHVFSAIDATIHDLTPDELEPYKIPAKPGHVGNAYALDMKCWVNGIEVSSGSMGDMDWTFAEIIERCSYGVDILPGDVIGSGTVGTGCFLELNGTGLLIDPNFKPQWLQPGDIVEMEITGLGRLTNTIIKADTDWSILKLKKKSL